jgi:preprotein translocase subunit YajC
LSSLGAVLPLVLLAVLGYFLLIRPTRRRAQEVAVLQRELAPGCEVMLTSGIFGRVEQIEDDRVLVEVSPGVVLSVHRGAIGKIVTPSPDQLAAEDELSDGADDVEPEADSDPDPRGAN